MTDAAGNFGAGGGMLLAKGMTPPPPRRPLPLTGTPLSIPPPPHPNMCQTYLSSGCTTEAAGYLGAGGGGLVATRSMRSATSGNS